MKKKAFKYYLFFLAEFFQVLYITQANAQFVAPRILQHPSQIQLVYQNILNSRYRETNLSVSPDGKYIFFMSGRGGMPWSIPFSHSYQGRPEYDGDIWYSSKLNGQWQMPKCLDYTINTDNGEDEPNVSPDGQTVYFQSWRSNWEYSNGPYYKSTLNGNYWGMPVGLGGGIHAYFMDNMRLYQAYGTDGVTISADGNTFIVACGPDYEGPMDLYISHKDAYGNWSYLQRLPVSSIGNERAPFLAADGRTLYFASDGYGGWGGLDIFKTVLNPDGSNSEIVNVGSPFNTVSDDYGLILTASGNEAYFVRDGDIYFANVTNASPELKPGSTLVIKGVVSDAISKKGIGAIVKLVDHTTGMVIGITLSNNVTGEYSFFLPDLNLSIYQEASQQGFDKEEKQIEVDLKPGLNEIISNIELHPFGKKSKEAAADMGLLSEL